MSSLVTIIELRETIVEILAKYEKSYNLLSICQMLGLEPGTESDAFNSKRVYVRNRLVTKNMPFLIELGEKLLDRYPQETDLEDMIKLFKASGHRATGEIKNLIFAADGYKPELVLEDAVTNKIKIVANEQYCLVYDQPITQSGLSWGKLAEWWAKKQSLPYPHTNTELDLFNRLRRSLAPESPPEVLLFDTYFTSFQPKLAERMPALIPQVYLHFDPKTLKELQGNQRLPRQRMDFLILFSPSERVVIEVDGKQHYSENTIASPKKYAEMVAEDRRLRLSGYEIYRFGGYELDETRGGRQLIQVFFEQLFEKHRISTT